MLRKKRGEAEEKRKEIEYYIQRWEYILEEIRKIINNRLPNWKAHIESEKNRIIDEQNEIWSESVKKVNGKENDMKRRYHIDHITNALTRQDAQRFYEEYKESILHTNKKINQWMNEYKNVLKLEENIQREYNLHAYIKMDVYELDNYIYKLMEIASEIAGNLITTGIKEEYDIMAITNRAKSTKLVTQFIARCAPFWNVNLDRSEDVDDSSLEKIKLLGIYDPRSPFAVEIHEKHQFEPISSGDPRLFAAVHIEHGLNPRFIMKIGDYFRLYQEFSSYPDEPTHLDRCWTDMPEIVLEEDMKSVKEKREDCAKKDDDAAKPAEEQ